MSDLSNDPQGQKGSKTKKILFLGFGVLLAGVLSFFGIEYYKKFKEEHDSPEPDVPDFNKNTVKKAPTKFKNTAASKGNNSSSTSAAGKSSSTGSKTSTTNAASSSPLQTVKNARQLASDLHDTISDKDFSKTFSLLRGIKNVVDYSVVSTIFSASKLSGVRQTLVNGLLNTFKEPHQRTSLQKAFYAMGLKFNGKKWTLAGIDQRPLLVTIHATRVWQNPSTSVAVPEKMVLSPIVTRRGEFTVFENENQHFLVKSKYVTFYKS